MALSRNKVIAVATVLAIIVSLTALASFFSKSYEKPETKKIRLKGSDTMLELCMSWAKDYMEKVEGVDIDVHGGGSREGILALINGTVDIAQASRPMKPSELDQARAAGIEPIGLRVAIDGICVIVNEKNPVKNLSVEQLRGIFNGSIDNWSKVGGKDKAIKLYGRHNVSGTYAYFQEKVLKGEPYSSNMIALDGNTAILNNVQGNEGAIGYVGIGYARNVSGISVLAISASPSQPFISPLNQSSVLAGEYYLARSLYLYTSSDPQPYVLDFLRWVLRMDKGQAIAKAIGFYELTPEMVSIEISKLPVK